MVQIPMRVLSLAAFALITICSPSRLLGQNPDHAQVMSLDKLELHNVIANLTAYRGLPVRSDNRFGQARPG